MCSTDLVCRISATRSITISAWVQLPVLPRLLDTQSRLRNANTNFLKAPGRNYPGERPGPTTKMHCCFSCSRSRWAGYNFLMSVGWKKNSKFKRKELHKSEAASSQHLNHPDFHAGKLLLLFSLCHCKCAPRLLTLFLLSHSGAPSLNASMIVRFLLKFGTWRRRDIPSDSLLQVDFRDSAAPRKLSRNYFVVLCLISA